MSTFHLPPIYNPHSSNQLLRIAVIALPLAFISSLNAQDSRGFTGPRIPPPSSDSQQQRQLVATGPNNQQPVIYEAPPPVTINDKKASDLTDDELKEFLASKIKTVYQSPDDVELLRIAPGYALTVTFDEAITGVVIGDPNLVSVAQQGKTLVLSAKQRNGDTSLQLMFPGNKILDYHIFIAPNFVSAQSTIRVVSNDDDSSPGASPKSPYVTAEGDLDIASVAKVISNYDALVQQKALNPSSIRRLPVFKKSAINSFEFYYIYLFKNGPAAISFAYTNPFPYAIKYNESQLRFQVGSMQFVPDFVSFNKTRLESGETTTGFAVFANPPFSFQQQFELIWK